MYSTPSFSGSYCGSSSCSYGSSCGNNPSGSGSMYTPMNFDSYETTTPGAYSSSSWGDNISQNYSMSRFSGSSGSYQSNEAQDQSPSRLSNNISSDFFDPESFLSTYRFPTKFIGKAEDIQGLVEECFEKTLGEKMPDNLFIRICDKEEMKSIHEKFGGRWSDGIVGFAINRNEKNQINDIFIKEDSLDKVMVTIGHEIGHVLGKNLGGIKEEEKAFAFELAWLDTIREHDIGCIGKNIIQINPAKNNFHDIAFDFVISLVRAGQRAIDVFRDLVCSA